MPDTPVGITTLEKLRLHVLRDSTDDSSDSQLTMYGEVMSERVADFCEREFLPAPATDGDNPVLREFFYDGQGELDLTPYDLREIVSVEIDSDNPGAPARTLTAAEYKPNPRGRTKQGTYLSLDLIVPVLPPVHWGFDWTVKITGRWGMTAVPKSAELAVWIAVDNVMDSPGGFASQQIGGLTVSSEPIDPEFDLSERGGLPRTAIMACLALKRRRRMRSLQLQHPRHRRRFLDGNISEIQGP